MYTSLKTLKDKVKDTVDTTELDKTLEEYINTAISEFSDFSGKFTLSDTTAQILAS